MINAVIFYRFLGELWQVVNVEKVSQSHLDHKPMINVFYSYEFKAKIQEGKLLRVHANFDLDKLPKRGQYSKKPHKLIYFKGV